LVSGAGGNKYGTEESHIAKTLTWLREKEPRLMVHVDKITTVGCDFLPGPAFRTIYRAKFRLLVLTHGDVLSARALQHQIALAEDLAAQHSHNQYFPAAIFVVNLQMVQKQKQLKHLIDAMYGAFYLNHMKQRAFVVSGIPNVGKSSLILPLTRGRTLMVKKKRHYHLPKVGPIAGLTLGIKAHVLQCPNHNQEISLYDTPGLRYVRCWMRPGVKVQNTIMYCLIFLSVRIVMLFFHPSINPSVHDFIHSFIHSLIYYFQATSHGLRNTRVERYDCFQLDHVPESLQLVV
jgi:GTP-binding protein EngB required for normal cell division